MVHHRSQPDQQFGRVAGTVRVDLVHAPLAEHRGLAAAVCGQPRGTWARIYVGDQTPADVAPDVLHFLADAALAGVNLHYEASAAALPLWIHQTRDLALHHLEHAPARHLRAVRT